MRANIYADNMSPSHPQTAVSRVVPQQEQMPQTVYCFPQLHISLRKEPHETVSQSVLSVDRVSSSPQSDTLRRVRDQRLNKIA